MLSAYRYLVLLLLLWIHTASAGFGLSRRKKQPEESPETEAVVQETGEIAEEEDASTTATAVNMDLVDRLIQNSGADAFVLSESVAVDIAAVLQAAQRDPETSLLLLRLKQQGTADSLRLEPDQIVAGLAEMVSEMEMLEVLFTHKGPERAVVEMVKEGLVEADRVSEYQKDPQLLLDDTRKSLYLTFCSLAVAGGYL